MVGLLFEFVYSEGYINLVLTTLGFKPIPFLTDPAWFVPLYVATEVWQKTGYMSIIYLAALSAIDRQLYEAAIVDGANRWHQALHITFPGILSTVKVILILSVGRIVNVSFTKVFLMYNPAIYERADVLMTYVYRRGIQGTDFSYAATVGLFNSVIALLLVIVANTISRRVSEESVW